jgi:hypothetical protein
MQNPNAVYSAYPNPTKDMLNIDFAKKEFVKIYLLDKFGKEKIYFEAETDKATLNLSALAQDLYILKIITPAAVYTEQVIKE